MNLRLLQSKSTLMISPAQVQDYRTFREHYPRGKDTTELQVFERFYAARYLVERGLATYLNPIITGPKANSEIAVDACGVEEDWLTIVCCEADKVDPSLASILALVGASENAQAIILASPTLDLQGIEEPVAGALHTGKVVIESMGWFQDHLDTTLRETLRLVDLLGNETRIRMLTPLFRKTSAKREYRTMINPKLVYQNLSILAEAGLVRQSEGNYELSELGKTILAEFITFLEKTRKALDLANLHEEVKHE